MADIFSDTPPTLGAGEEDPAADFLAREQSQLAGLDSDGDNFGSDDFSAPAQTEADAIASAGQELQIEGRWADLKQPSSHSKQHPYQPRLKLKSA